MGDPPISKNSRTPLLLIQIFQATSNFIAKSNLGQMAQP